MPRYPDISLAVDAVVFGYTKELGISVLLIQRKYNPYKDSWALPGGFVNKDESLEDAVSRELEEETGIKINYLEQLYTFGTPNRDPRKRVVSVGYFVLVRPDVYELHAASDAQEARWFNIAELPELAFDHQLVIDTAIERLQGKIRYKPIGFELLDKKFPFSDLEKLYSTLLGRPIDRRNFKKKIMALGILEELDEKVKHAAAGRPANLFRFNKRKYRQLQKSGMVFEL